MNKSHNALLRMLLCFLPLIGIACLSAGCGPENCQARFLASWSADGTRVALVLDPDTDSENRSGLWIASLDSYAASELVVVPPRHLCLHPQWSSSGEEILFGVLDDSEQGRSDPDKASTFSVWIARTDGSGARKVADSRTPEDSKSFLAPNAIAWGKIPGTVLYQTAAGEKITAVLLDLNAGETREFLPAPADDYSLEFSPSGESVAALLMDSTDHRAAVYVAGSAALNWRQIGSLHYDQDRFGSYSSLISWSPDSSSFVVTEMERSASGEESEEAYLRLFVAESGKSRRLCAAKTNAEILWSPRGDALIFSGAARDGAGGERGLYRVDIITGEIVRLITDDAFSLVSWDSQDDRIYYFGSYREVATQTAEEGSKKNMQFYSCDRDGNDIRLFGASLPAEAEGWSLSADGHRAVVYPGSGSPSLVEFGSRPAAHLPIVRRGISN